MKINLQVVGTYCNSWPNLIVELNGVKIHEQKVKNTEIIELESENILPQGNRLILGMRNKAFGKNGIYDTVVKDNKIIEDKTIQVSSIKLDDVECKTLFNNTFHVHRTDKQPSYFPDKVNTVDVMGYNGYFTFTFDLPLYNSLTNKKFKKPLQKDVSYFSNSSAVFHYEEETKVINEIKNILKEVDEKFSDKRSQIRNT